jgi:replicative DNA helicase
MGKTSFVLNIAQHVGTQTDMTVGFFSLEMSKEQLFMRMLTSEARIDAHRFRSGLPEREGLRRPVARARHARRGARVHRRHGVDRRARDARQGAAGLQAEHGLHLLIIDYIQLMQGRGPVREPPGRARRRSRDR